MLTFDVVRTHNLIQLREPITLTVGTSRLMASLFFLAELWSRANNGAMRLLGRAIP